MVRAGAAEVAGELRSRQVARVLQATVAATFALVHRQAAEAAAGRAAALQEPELQSEQLEVAELALVAEEQWEAYLTEQTLPAPLEFSFLIYLPALNQRDDFAQV